MKNQYFGDVNDYVKYGLLRVLGEASGLRVGVAWMLTPNDDRPDGSRTAFWKDLGWREHDPVLFDRLARLSSQPAARNVELFRRWDLVPGATDFGRELPDDADARTEWVAAALETLADCPLVFFDPDNGFEVGSVARGRRGSNRYLYWDEAVKAWNAGHSLLVYQHFQRRERDGHARDLHGVASERLAGARVTLFRTAHVLFVLAARPEHAAGLARAADCVGERWSGRIDVAGFAPDDRAQALVGVCESFTGGGERAAAAALAGRYPFAPAPSRERRHTELDALGIWVRDGFVDRYDGTRLVFPGTLHVLSAVLPDEFPYHPAWLDLHPTLDHVVPVARGGLDEPSNWVTTSQRNHSARAHWTLEELGWTLHPEGGMDAWDGLTGWFRSTLAAREGLRRHAAIRRWAGLLERVPQRR